MIKCLYLIFVSHLSLNALPIRSDIQNGTSNSTKNSALAENQVEKNPIALNDLLSIQKLEPPRRFNLTQVVKEIKEFGIESLNEDKHLEGLPLDRHGKVNPDFHKEIFLGNHEFFESQIQVDEGKRNEKLKEIFKLADVDESNKLTRGELLDYVFRNIQEHLREAKERNTQLFVLIDDDKDGKVTWHEYFVLYVKFHHMNSTNITDTLEFVNEPLDNNVQRELIKIRYRWVEADATADNSLDIDEFLAFRHPEMTGNSYKYIVDDIISQMDRNDDQKLSENEFAFLPASVVEDETNKDWLEMDKRWLEEQKQEFHEMDTDANGVLTREELQRAYDPMNRVHIDNQIKKLFAKVDDEPKDNLLSLEEIIKHADIFTDMHILDPDKALHDEM